MERPRVFVTDGSYSNGLAAVRALARDGFRVVVGERAGVPLPAAVSYWSRYCTNRVVYPDPDVDRRATAAALAETFERERFDVAIPVGLDMTEIFVEYRDRLSAPTMLPPTASFEIASDKRRTFVHAESIGIPVPRTLPLDRWRELGLPVVFKDPRKGAFVAHTADAAAAEAARLTAATHVAQAFVPGRNGFGYFGFFEDGRERAYFLHERLVQFPKEGGASVVARAIRNERVRELGRRLLESLNWHGAAMVEFKRSDADGEFYLIEINPKLWGSLDLAIAAGCNFPAWIARSVAGIPLDLPSEYRSDVRYQWIVPQGLKSFLRYPEFRWQFVRNVFDAGVRSDVKLLDPLPTVAGLVAMAANAVRR